MNKFEFAEQLIAIVKRDVAPALGCTEPISLALASAIAKSHLGSEPVQIQAKVSPNLMKTVWGLPYLEQVWWDCRLWRLWGDCR